MRAIVAPAAMSVTDMSKDSKSVGYSRWWKISVHPRVNKGIDQIISFRSIQIPAVISANAGAPRNGTLRCEDALLFVNQPRQKTARVPLSGRGCLRFVHLLCSWRPYVLPNGSGVGCRQC
jgi:hypothetical protein